MWKTRGQNCSICNSMAGRVYTYDTWIASTLTPGFHLNCNCYLERVADDYPLSDPDIFGSNLDLLLDNEYIGFLNMKLNSKPYNIEITRNITELMMSEGLTIQEAFRKTYGSFKLFSFQDMLTKIWAREYPQWQIWRKLHNMDDNVDGTISTTKSPTVTTPAALTPRQSYHYGK